MAGAEYDIWSVNVEKEYHEEVAEGDQEDARKGDRLIPGKVKDPTQQQQQKIMMIMPFVFTWICLQMPAGMVLYWFVNNVLGIGQQWLVNRKTTRLEAAQQKA